MEKTGRILILLFTLILCSDLSAQERTSETVYKVVEEMPLFGNCETKSCSDKRLITFIQKNVKYPKKDRKKGNQGRVFVTFVVEKDGSTSSPKVVRCVSPTIDKEAVKVIKKMSQWTPGRNKGKPVRVHYTLPITFSLGK